MSQGDVEKTAAETLPNEKAPSTSHQQLPQSGKHPNGQLEDSVSVNSAAPSISIPDVRLATTRWELWSYYLYYVGNNGLAGFNFGPSAFQNLLYLAAVCDANGNNCTLPFAGSHKSSELLNTN